VQTGAVLALVLADTHMQPGTARVLPDDVRRVAGTVDAILHAGDVVTRHLLDDLAELAPVHAVLGNNDHSLVGVLPETLQVELGGVTVAMIHDSGPAAGRAGRMRRLFPSADVVVYGHSHIPLDETGTDGQRLFNPGSCTERRRAPAHTYGLLDLVDGVVRSHRIVAIRPGTRNEATT
jgi:putative phosphoesterase